MTAVARTTVLRPTPGEIYRRVTGTPDEVAATVALVRQSGRFLAVTTPRQVTRTDTRVTVVVTLRERPAPTARPVPRWVKRTVIIVPTVTAAVVGVGYALTAAIHAATRAVSAAAPALLGTVFVLAVLFLIGRFLLAGKSSCSGLHCSGCRRH